jgi:hypothetical protein
MIANLNLIFRGLEKKIRFIKNFLIRYCDSMHKKKAPTQINA